MVKYQSLDPVQKIQPGVHPKQPMDGIAHIHPTYQTMSSDCIPPQISSKTNFETETSKLKNYTIQKDSELLKKIESLSSKVITLNNRLEATQTEDSSISKKTQELEEKLISFQQNLKVFDDYIANNKYVGSDAISISDASIHTVALKLKTGEKLLSMDFNGIYTTLDVEYVDKKIVLKGYNGSEITSCDLNFTPKSISKVRQDDKYYVKFEFEDGSELLADIENFIDIQDEGEGNLIINGKQAGIKIAKDDNLLYLDDNLTLHSRDLTETEEWQELEERLKTFEKVLEQVRENTEKMTELEAEINDYTKLRDDVNELKLIVKGGEAVDTSTGESVSVQSLQEQLVGKEDDIIEVDSSTSEINQSSLNLNSLKNYVDNKVINIEEDNLVWHEQE